jgi:hypothetical protein
MTRKTTLAMIIVAASFATTIIAMSMTTSVFASNGQGLAPGQGQTSEGDPFHNNPSNNQLPPGQGPEDSIANPGQCQKNIQGPAFGLDKDLAHDICID